MKLKNNVVYVTLVITGSFMQTQASLVRDVLGGAVAIADDTVQRSENLITEGKFKTNEQLDKEQPRTVEERERAERKREEEKRREAEMRRRRTEEIDRQRELERSKR